MLKAMLKATESQAMLKATEINRTVHKHSNLTTLHGGGGQGCSLVLSTSL